MTYEATVNDINGNLTRYGNSSDNSSNNNDNSDDTQQSKKIKIIKSSTNSKF